MNDFLFSVVEEYWRCTNMIKRISNDTTQKRAGKNMAVLAKPINRVTVISKKDSLEFVREFNENKVTKEFLYSCKKAGKLFVKRK